ncbi:MAG: hypothetical protein Q4P14_01995 [Methanobacteriaceae archaeon]|nr:hypothetical protein [Methanobacteriaceae archaeon]
MADNDNENNKCICNDDAKSESKEPKIEICYTCGKEFDMNNEEGAHYHYDEYPMCGYCSNFYGFYQKTSNDIL